RLLSVVALPAIGETTLLRLAASLERGSEHPLAAAIVAGAQARGCALVDTQAFRSITGKGVAGQVEGRQVVLGDLRINKIPPYVGSITTSHFGNVSERFQNCFSSSRTPWPTFIPFSYTFSTR